MFAFQNSVSPPSADRSLRDGKRPHQKVRSGCLRCKSRRVKCNEAKPQCAHCARHREACIYLPIKGSSASGRRPTKDVTASHDSYSMLSSTRAGNFDVIDLELMHQWTLKSYLGFGDRDTDCTIWQNEVTHMAFDCMWLMQGILSVAALQLSRERPARRKEYLDIATHHQDNALVTFREILNNVCSTVNAENCHAVIAFAGLTVAYGFVADGKHCSPRQLSWQGTPEWIKLLRGPRQALHAVRHWVLNGPMAYQIRDEFSGVHLPRSPFDQRLSRLKTVFGSQSQRDFDTYTKTLDLLRHAYDQAFASGKNLGPKLAVYNWVSCVPSEFFDELLDGGEAPALILLAYLCVLVKGAARSSWFMEGSGESTLASIRSAIPENVRHWLDWPMEEIERDWNAQSTHEVDIAT